MQLSGLHCVLRDIQRVLLPEALMLCIQPKHDMLKKLLSGWKTYARSPFVKFATMLHCNIVQCAALVKLAGSG